MKAVLILAQVLSAISICWAQSPEPQARLEAEYYVTAYAQHYRVFRISYERHGRPCRCSRRLPFTFQNTANDAACALCDTRSNCGGPPIV